MIHTMTSYDRPLKRDNRPKPNPLSVSEIFAILKVGSSSTDDALPPPPAPKSGSRRLHREKKIKKNATKPKKQQKSFFDMPSPFTSEDEGFRTSSSGSQSDEATVTPLVFAHGSAFGEDVVPTERGGSQEEGIDKEAKEDETMEKTEELQQTMAAEESVFPEATSPIRQEPVALFPVHLMGDWLLHSWEVVDATRRVHRPVNPKQTTLTFHRVEGALMETNFMSAGGPVQVAVDDEWRFGEKWTAFGEDKLQFSLSITEDDVGAHTAKFYLEQGLLVQFEKELHGVTIRRYVRALPPTVAVRPIYFSLPPPPLPT